jgi:hypothetical protein
MRTRTKLVVAATTAVALAGGVGVGIAAADPTTSPSAPTSASPQAGPKSGAPGQGHRARDLTARALHGEATVGGKKNTRVIDFQRGAVTQVSGTSITVKSTDGFSATYVVAGTTKVRKDKATAAIADVKVNDAVRVVAVKDGSTVTARSIRDHQK